MFGDAKVMYLDVEVQCRESLPLPDFNTPNHGESSKLDQIKFKWKIMNAPSLDMVKVSLKDLPKKDEIFVIKLY